MIPAASIEAVFTAREQMLEFNVQPLLALESLMTVLQLPPRSGLQPVLPAALQSPSVQDLQCEV